jgi:hypothetical protein
MSTVTNSAAQSATQLFGTITTTANAVSTMVTVVGTVFDVTNVKAQDWLSDTRIKSAAMAHDRELAIVDDIAISMAHRINERTKLLNNNADLKAAYLASLAGVTAAVAQAKQKYGMETVVIPVQQPQQ